MKSTSDKWKWGAHEIESERLVDIELNEQQWAREEARERDALRVQVAAGQRADQVGDALPLDADAGRELIVAHLIDRITYSLLVYSIWTVNFSPKKS